jgi:hypothetical protein
VRTVRARHCKSNGSSCGSLTSADTILRAPHLEIDSAKRVSVNTVERDAGFDDTKGASGPTNAKCCHAQTAQVGSLPLLCGSYLHSSISGPTISVEVFRIVLSRGILVPACDTATFHVHHKLLCANSAYFRAATANGERHVTFKTDDDPANFQIYVQWLYYQELKPELSKGGTVCTRLMRAYVLGELSRDACFQNAIIAATAQFCVDHRVVPTSAAINVAYHGTATRSPARRLLSDLWVCIEVFPC